MGYTFQAVKGLSWMGGIRVSTRVLTLVKTAIIARILSPVQFGVFGIGTLVLALVEILTETGINIFLLQKKDDIGDYVDTAWIVSIIRGVVIALVIALSAKLLAEFYHAPEAFSVLVLVSLVPLIRGFINPSEVVFQKQLEFHKEFYFRTGLFLIETILSIIFVLVYHSVQGLILALIGSAIAEVVFSFLLIKPRPVFAFHIKRFREVIHFGKWVTVATIFNYFYQHGDDIAVGRLLGTGALGYYDMAYRISLAPLTDIAEVINKVTFPVYVKISGDASRLKRAYLRTLLAVCLLVFPIGCILYLFPEQIITILLGPKWLPAAAVLRILGIFGVIRAVSSFSASVFLTIERQQIFTIITFTGMLGLAVTIVPFVMRWGILGAGFSALFGTALTLPVIFYFVNKYIYAAKD